MHGFVILVGGLVLVHWSEFNCCMNRMFICGLFCVQEPNCLCYFCIRLISERDFQREVIRSKSLDKVEFAPVSSFEY